MSDGVRCMWMRGGTSKGAFFLKSDLPADEIARDTFLLRVMGSPDPRQIDGVGGADPLTSKVAVISRSEQDGVDIDYLFLQVFVDRALVTDSQNCGNMLAGAAPFAIERGLVAASGEATRITIFMQNTGQVAVATVCTPGGRVTYEGNAGITGVPGTAAPIPLVFRGTAGSSCGTLLPTGRAVDEIDGIPVTLIDNGMPCVVLRATDVGVAGTEDRETLEADTVMKAKVESIRLQAGPLMNLGDVREKSVPKMMLVAAPQAGGAICVRSLIPHRVHASIGVLGAVSVATCCLIEGSSARTLARVPAGDTKILGVEHPTGLTECLVTVDAQGQPVEAGMLRTARKLMDGHVYV